MTQTLTNAEKLRLLPWNTALNATNSIFGQLTFFGPAYVLFLSELKFTNTQIGFLLSLLPFTGLVALVIAPAVARFGYKRTYVTFFSLRKVVTAGLLLVPWVVSQAGESGLLVYVTAIAAGFALCRSISEVGYYPWAQEFIPNTIRGRYAAINDIAARLTAIASLAIASIILGLPIGLDRFMILFVIGLVFGVAAVWSSTHIPGGAPARDSDAATMSHRHMLRVLRDRNFLLYMAGLGVVTIGTTPFASFLPLFVEQQVGLDESRVVLLTIGTLVGGLTSTYLLGWAADRYGSKPVMLSGLYAKILIPFMWMLIPRFSELSLPTAFLISMLSGIADIAWAIGSARLLYVKVVPEDKRAEYMAVYYAMIGLIGGLSQVLGGRVLDLTQNLTGQFLIFTIDPFFPLFVLAIVLTAVSVLLFARVKADSPVSVSEFAGLFTHGNPILALESLVRYYRARDERATIAMTQRMGTTNSPLTVDELLEALKDPRFNVRFEAIISIARMESDPRLVEAVVNILEGTEISLSVIAAWALGRMGDEQAIIALRRALDSSYRSLRAHSARALGTLGDKTIIPILLDRLTGEEDKGLRVAYASALGNLHAEEATDTLLAVLEEIENEGARLELSLALARIVGHEQHFIRLLRQIRQDKGTATAQAILAMRRRIGAEGELKELIGECADAFARDDLDRGAGLLSQVIREISVDLYTPTGRVILQECRKQLQMISCARVEYLILALHVLNVALVETAR